MWILNIKSITHSLWNQHRNWSNVLEWKSQFESSAEYKEQKIQKEKYAVVVIGLELKRS